MSHNQLRVVTIALLMILTVPVAEAQRGGFGGRDRGGRSRGFGGPGGFGGSTISVLQEEAVESELGLTEDQRTRIAEISESARPDFSQMMPLMMQMRQAETDEERDKLRAQMGEIARAPLEKAESDLKSVLSPEQFARYEQARRQRAGVRGLLDDRENAALGLTDDQKKQLQDKSREMFEQFRDLRRLPEDEQQAARDKMESDLMSVLTDAQRTKWNDLLGEPIEGIGSGSRPRGPDGPPPGRPVASTPAAPMTQPPSGPPPSGPPPSAPSEPSGDPLDDMLGALEGPSRPTPSAPSFNPNAPKVADFGRAPADGPADSFSFNFRNAPWEDVLTLFAQLAGLTLDPSVMPPGVFDYYDNATYTPKDALNVMNGYLLPRGFLLLQRDKFLVVREISGGIPPSLVPTIDVGELDSRGKNEMVRVIFDTGQTPASELVDDVKALLGSQGNAVALAASNRLIVEDLARTLIEVRGLLEDTTRPVGPDGLAFRSYRLVHVNARDVEPLVKALLGVQSGLGSTGGSSSSSRSSSRGSSDDDRRRQFFEAMMRSRGGGGPPGFGGDRGSDRGSSRDRDSSSSSSSQAVPARVAVDDRTNTLMVTAKPSDLEIVAQAVKELDVDDNLARNGSQRSSDTPILRVYEIDDGDLGKISETLMAMVPGIAINEDNRADQIHVVATADKHREVAQMVAMITGDTLGHQVAVIPLSRMDAYSAGQLIINMFASEDQSSIPSVQADPSGQRLIVRGSEADVQQVRSLLLQLGETGEPIPQSARPRGPIREIPLGGSDPQETLRLLQRLWNAGHEKKLQVEPSPGLEPLDIDRRQTRPQPRREDDRRASVDSDSKNFAVVFQDEPAAGSAPTDDATEPQATPSQGTGPGNLSATIIGDRLVISSDDLEALDSLETLAGRLLSQTQSRTRWTVIYLQVADASETATMLGTFFPNASVGSTSIIDTASMAGQVSPTLQIIPETRNNALFLSGSPAEIADVKEVLRILDSTDIPTAYRDRIARSIPVQYASVVDVAEVLRDVFADVIAQPQQQNDRGRFGSQSSNTTQTGKMTIGVDDVTSRIVVSCDEALFEQVEAVVFDLDAAAQEARRSVRVVNLQNTDPAAVKGVLGTLLPQVSFTTSSSRTSTSSSRSGGSSDRRDSDSGRSDNPFDFFRRMRESRERGESPFGGSSGRPSFGPPGGFGGFGGRSFGGDRGGDRGRGGR